jgi:hypothetical protein
LDGCFGGLRHAATVRNGSRFPKPRPMHGNRLVTSPRPWLACCATTPVGSAAGTSRRTRQVRCRRRTTLVRRARRRPAAGSRPIVSAVASNNILFRFIARQRRHSDQGERNERLLFRCRTGICRARALTVKEKALPLLPAPAPRLIHVFTETYEEGNRCSTGRVPSLFFLCESEQPAPRVYTGRRPPRYRPTTRPE